MKKLFLITFSFVLIHCEELSKTVSQIELPALVDTYTGYYKGTEYEMWVEDTGEKSGILSKLAVLLFERSKAELVKETLGKFQTPQSYFKSVCEHIEAPRGVPNEDLPYPEVVVDTTLWNDIGAFGLAFLNPPVSDKSLVIKTIHYILLPENDEHSLEALKLNSEGEITAAQLSETGYLKKFSSYFTKVDAKINMEKKLLPAFGLLTNYSKNRDIVMKHFEIARKEGKPKTYCEKLLTQ